MHARTLRSLFVAALAVVVLRNLLLRWARTAGVPMGSADQWAPVPRAPGRGDGPAPETDPRS